MEIQHYERRLGKRGYGKYRCWTRLFISNSNAVGKLCFFASKKGNIHEPAIVSQDKLKKPLKIWQDSSFDDSDWNKMHQALLGVIESEYGTARSIRDLKEFQAAGKSGTAELVSLDSKERIKKLEPQNY